jgi:inhibitor of cysteine peptidase
MKTKLGIFGILIVLSLSLLGCTVGSQEKFIEVSIDDLSSQKNIMRQIEVPVSYSLKVMLGSNATTGFSWSEEAQISDATILKQTDHGYITPTSDLAGAPGKEVWTFSTLKKGTATISMEYSRTWEGSEQAEWTFELTVTVK